MDSYSFERWMIERHRRMVRVAEERTRLKGWQPQEQVAQQPATHLRVLADRLDGPDTSTAA